VIHELVFALLIRNSTPAPCNVVRPGMTTMRYCPSPSWSAPRAWHPRRYTWTRPADILLPGGRAYVIG
jgi:hypothetical protein